MKSFIDGFHEISTTTVTGVMDILVVKQKNSKFKSSPFYLSFSIASVFKPRGKIVNISVNGEEKLLKMRLNRLGRGYFPKNQQKQLSDSCSQLSMSQDQDFQQPKRKQKISKNQFSVYWDSKINRCNYQLLDHKTDQKQQKSVLHYFLGLFRSQKHFEPREVQNKYSDHQNAIVQHYYQGQQTSLDPVILLSLCGNLLKSGMSDKQLKQIFYKNRVHQSSFTEDPLSILGNSNLMVLIQGTVYTWQVGLSVLISKLAFGRVLKPMVDKLTQPKKGYLWSKKGGVKIEFKQDQFNQAQKKQSALSKNRQRQHSIQSHNSSTSSTRKRKFNLIPTHQQIKLLDLKQGINNIQFKVGQVNLSANIFVVQYSTKIIVSDIDGTITKQDVLGQLYPIVGKSFLHPGVIPLYQQLHNRNYQLIYLTARSLSQTKMTKQLLIETQDQQNKRLPLGPLITSYQGLYAAFKKQVIDKTPQMIKIQVLNAIKKLFPQNPYWAGLGNRSSDFLAYKAMGIKQSHIFILNTNSQVMQMDRQEQMIDYNILKQRADQIFPNLSIQK